jgi:RNA polymerase sigma-70 factor (ECF subfamily)
VAFLVLLESLSPVERAVFLLREVFDYDYQEIAQIVDKSENNCRQIFGRARRHLDAHHARFQASTEQSEALVQSFLAAARDGDLGQLVDLLAADAVFCGDGGGKATAIAEPMYGRDRIAAFLLAIFERNLQLGLTFEPVRVNGGPGIISRDRHGNVVGVLSVDVADGLIQTLRSVVNPDKLQHVGPVSDFLRVGPPDGDREP